MASLGDLFDSESTDGAAYRQLVARPRISTAEVAAQLGISVAEAHETLERLVGLRAALKIDSDVDVVWDAQSPDWLSDTETKRRQEQLDAMKSAAVELSDVFRAARRSGHLDGALQPVHAREEMLAEFEDMQTHARSRVKLVERPPFLSSHEREYQQFLLKRSRIEAGVRYQTLYQDSIYNDAERLKHALQADTLGAHARTLPDPPFKLILSDDECAILVLHADDRSAEPMGLRIGPSRLLDILVKTFDVLWSLSTPISVTASADQLEERDRAILTLMAVGATDETIARRLDMSRRTVVRRTARLLERLGASTRFQAGVQATRRGWL